MVRVCTNNRDAIASALVSIGSKEMKKILEEVQSGAFAREWIAECEAGGPNMAKLREASHTHPLEKVGKKLRKMMSWLKPNRPADTAASPVDEPMLEAA